jgi:hypothetical protein
MVEQQAVNLLVDRSNRSHAASPTVNLVPDCLTRGEPRVVVSFNESALQSLIEGHIEAKGRGSSIDYTGLPQLAQNFASFFRGEPQNAQK